MRWFKHYSDVRNSESLSILLDELGLEGYARYWILMEYLSSNFDGISVSFRIHRRNVRDMLRLRSWTGLGTFMDRIGTVRGLVVNQEENVYHIEAPILLELKSKDFKRALSGSVSEAPKKESKNKSKKEKKEIDIPVLEAKPPIDYKFFMDHWNNLLGESLSPIKKMTDKRKLLIRTLLKNYPDFNLLDYLKEIESSDFLMGASSKWSADFDFCFKHSNYLKVIEGNYKNNTNQKTNAEAKQDKMLNILKGFENADRANNN